MELTEGIIEQLKADLKKEKFWLKSLMVSSLIDTLMK